MSCKETLDIIDGYLDGELDLIRNLEIEKHIKDCEECSRVYKNRQALRSSMRSGPLYFEPPVNLEKRVQSVLRRANKTETKPLVFSWPWLSALASLAFVTIIIWGLVPVLTGPSANDLLTQEVLSSHVRSLMADHLTDVSSSDQHTVKPWFNGKLDFSPEVKDLAEHGFSLVGGRLDYVGKRPVAALVYHRRKHFSNLFIWPSTRDSDIPNKTMTRQGYNLIHWAKSGMTYWAVSDLNNGELQEFVRLIQKQAPPTSSP